MIGRLRGLILKKQPPQVLIEVSGVGYEVHMPMTCFYSLPDIHHEAIILTQVVVREDAWLLFGFNNEQERTLFRELIKVNGVGPKLALAILSGMSAQQFVMAVEKKEMSQLIKLPGVGKKTAERLIVEMQDRFKSMHEDFFEVDFSMASKIPTPTDHEAEAVSALVALGYKPQDASRMISHTSKTIIGEDVETLIREALRAAL